MSLTIFMTLFVLSSPSAESGAPLVLSTETRAEFIIPRARILLHRWLEPSYQVRMIASFDWTRQNGESTIF